MSMSKFISVVVKLIPKTVPTFPNLKDWRTKKNWVVHNFCYDQKCLASTKNPCGRPYNKGDIQH